MIIFDECHRSQFGDMHTAITKAFKRYHLFGFTGTPIFAVNAGSGGNPRLRTTEQAFGERLHTYTIVDAITDKNVLPFRIDYVNTIKVAADVTDKQVSAIDTERALLDSRADRRGRRLHPGALRPEDRRTSGYSYSLISNVSDVAAGATASRRSRSPAASTASTRCSPQRRSRPPSATTPSSPSSRRRCRPDRRLKVGLIYSYAPNEDEEDGLPRRGGLRDRRPRQVVTRLPRSGDRGLQRDVRHELRHLVRQVPELLQGPVAAAEEPGDRPGHRRQHVPDRLRRHHAEHAVRRQGPAHPRSDPGLLAHQPDPELGQDLRQHRHLPRPGGGDQRRHRPVRQQGRQGIVLLKPYADYYAEYGEQGRRAA